MPFGLGFFATAGGAAPVAAGDYDLLTTTVLGTAAASVTFSNLGDYASTYRHLQVRATTRSSIASGTDTGVYSRLNGDSGSNYSWHLLRGNGSSVTSAGYANQTWGLTGLAPNNNQGANIFAAFVIDLLDPYSSKNKTMRTATGTLASSVSYDIHSATWLNTASLTSWQIICEGGNFVVNSRFSLYGLKG